jgi:hypothetical protein
MASISSSTCTFSGISGGGSSMTRNADGTSQNIVISGAITQLNQNYNIDQSAQGKFAYTAASGYPHIKGSDLNAAVIALSVSVTGLDKNGATITATAFANMQIHVTYFATGQMALTINSMGGSAA